MKETLTCSSIQIITTFKHISSNDKFGKASNLDDIFHQNIKSLPKHQNELKNYLDSLNCKFSFIGLTETWLDEHDISNYTCLHRYRQNRKGGGVTIAVRNGIVLMSEMI